MVPSHKEMMLPILRFLSIKSEADRKEIYEFVAKYFKLSDDEKELKIPSGKVLLYVSRASWALSYLASIQEVMNLPKNKRPASKIGRGTFKITEFGVKICSDKNSEAKFSSWYDEVYNKTRSSKHNKPLSANEQNSKDITPIEAINSADIALKELLKAQILDEINAKSPKFFEDLVKNLLVKMGYGEGTLTKDGADGGIDGIINEDELGISKIYIQAKRWQGSITRPELNKFAGAILDKQTKKGVFITTSKFTKDAEHYAKNLQDHSIALIDGERLAELMIKYKVGVEVRQNIEICEVDKDFFDEFV